MLHNRFIASLNLNLLRLHRIRRVLLLQFPEEHSNKKLFKSPVSTVPPLRQIVNELFLVGKVGLEPTYTTYEFNVTL